MGTPCHRTMRSLPILLTIANTCYVLLMLVTWCLGIGFQRDETWIVASMPINAGVLLYGDLPPLIGEDNNKVVWSLYLLITGAIQWWVIGMIASAIHRSLRSRPGKADEYT